MNQLGQLPRMLRVFAAKEQTAPENLALVVDDLRQVLFSLIQDVEVLKHMLNEKGLWSEERYKQLRQQQMRHDHLGAGAAPWKGYSYYPHTLDEEQLLREKLGATEEDIQVFRQYVEDCQMMT